MSLLDKKNNETAACCCVDVGTIIEEKDCMVKYDATFASETAAAVMQQQLTVKAQEIETEPCEIITKIAPKEAGTQLSMEFHFCCAVEALIFQLALR